MTNKRIPDLTAATTPLAGTELVPLWDGTTTKQTTVAKILAPAAGNGVDFSANINAAGMTKEILTWYEEGTWNPALVPAVGTIAPNASLTQGLYTRIGRMVTVTCHIYVTSVVTPTGDLAVTGLPWSTAGDYGSRCAGAIMATNLNATATSPLMLFINGSSATIYIRKLVAGVATGMAADIRADSSIQFSLSYMTT